MNVTRIVLIGSGNLAEAVAQAIAQSSLDLVQVFGRNAARVQEVAALANTTGETRPEHLAAADLYLIAVSDRAVAQVADSLPIPPDAIVAHTAGSVSIEVLPQHLRHRAVFYPMQTFTRGRKVNFRQIPIFLEATDNTTLAALEQTAAQLSDKVIRSTSEQRAQIHLAAVFACNFANHMYAISDYLLRRSGLDFEVMKSLVSETTAKACDAPTPAAVQTGPAVRHDETTQARHEALLDNDPTLQAIYQIISKNIWETSKKI